MSDRVDATMDRMQVASRDEPVDLSRSCAGAEPLRTRNHPVLALSRLGYPAPLPPKLKFTTDIGVNFNLGAHAGSLVDRIAPVCDRR